MARGRKSYTIDEKISRQLQLIEELKSQLNLAEDKLKEFYKQKDEADILKIRAAIISSGKTINEVLESFALNA